MEIPNIPGASAAHPASAAPPLGSPPGPHAAASQTPCVTADRDRPTPPAPPTPCSLVRDDTTTSTRSSVKPRARISSDDANEHVQANSAALRHIPESNHYAMPVRASPAKEEPASLLSPFITFKMVNSSLTSR